jgi:hypothetical protein
MQVQLSRNFNIALCDHFGLKRVTDLKINTDPDEVFSATITVALTTDDLAAIAERMGAKEGKPTVLATGGPVVTNHITIDAVGTQGFKATTEQIRAGLARAVASAFARRNP